MRLEIDSNVAPQPLNQSQTTDHLPRSSGADAAKLLKEGIVAAQNGDRAVARKLLLAVAEMDPTSVDAWLWLSSISEYPEELLGFLNKVLAIDPENKRAQKWELATKSLLAKTFVQRGMNAHADGEPDFADQCFDKALLYDRRCASAWFWKASIADSESDREQYLARVLDIDPDNVEARAAMSSISENRVAARLAAAHAAAFEGDRNGAAEIVDELVDADNENLAAWLLRSQLAESFDEKLMAYRRALELDPENVFARSAVEYLTHSQAIAATASEAAAKVTSIPRPQNDFGNEVDIDAAAPSDLEGSPLFNERVPDPPVMPKPSEPFEFVASEPSTARSYDTVIDHGADTFEVDEDPVADHASEPNQVDQLPNFAAIDEVEQSGSTLDNPMNDGSPIVVEASDTPESGDDAENDKLFTSSEPESASLEFLPFEKAFPSLNNGTHDPTELSVDEIFANLGSESEVQSDAEINAALSVLNNEGVIEAVENVQEPEIVSTNGVRTQEPEAVEQWTDEVQEVSPQRTPPAMVKCEFCKGENESQAFTCSSCHAVLSLSEIDLLFGESHIDRGLLREVVNEMEADWSLRQFSEPELVTLALGHFNLGNYDQGMMRLQEAGRLNPNNVILGSQINSMAIRLEDHRRQEENFEAMPKGKTILVVDDSATVRKLISSKLEKCGHNVHNAVDGVEAIEILETMVPDLVLLDIAMPRMDGYAVCKQIRSNESTKDVPVVMISGKDGFFDKVRGKMAGTTGYITKPFGPETLMKALETYLLPESAVE